MCLHAQTSTHPASTALASCLPLTKPQPNTQHPPCLLPTLLNLAEPPTHPPQPPLQREKKRRWKAATKKAEEDTSTIHAKYIAKCEELLALESRLRSMDTALKLLGAGASSAGGFGPGGSNPATERSGLRSRATTRLSFMPAGAGFGLTDEAPVTKEDRTKGLLSGFHEDGRPVDVPEARKLLEEMWDELNKAAKMCGMLNDQMQDVDRQKHDLLVSSGGWRLPLVPGQGYGVRHGGCRHGAGASVGMSAVRRQVT